MSGLVFTSKKKWVRNLIFLIFVVVFAGGFRTYPNGARWMLNSNSPKLWVKFCDRTAITSNDLPQGDVLYGANLTFDILTQSVLNDFNNITTSYVRLYDVATDPSYTAAAAVDHTINICYGSASPIHSGYTTREESNGIVKSSTIVLQSDLKSSAKRFTRTLTHEIGHALGLDHPQDTNFAIMSYFGTTTRLEADDKMGITFLYPADENYAKEMATFGMSCSAK